MYQFYKDSILTQLLIWYIQWFVEEFPEIRKEDWYKEKKEYFEKVSDATYREDWRHPDPELRDLWCKVVQNDSSDTW